MGKYVIGRLDILYIFAKKVESGKIFEVLNIEMYQGDVGFIEVMDSNGSIEQIEHPEGFEYIMQHDIEGDDEDK